MALNVRSFRFLLFWAMLSCLFNIGLPVQAQISEDEWEELTKDVDYGEIKDKEPEKEDGDSWEWPDLNFPGLSEEVTQIILISLLVIALTVILIKILGNPGARKIDKKKKAFTLEEAEEDLEFAELGSILDRLIQEENYREALRVLYLKSLQLLHEKGKIVWRKEKTNFDYIRELKESGYQSDFHKLTTVYELKWYGEVQVGSAEFQQLLTAFLSFNRSVEK